MPGGRMERSRTGLLGAERDPPGLPGAERTPQDSAPAPVAPTLGSAQSPRAAGSGTPEGPGPEPRSPARPHSRPSALQPCEEHPDTGGKLELSP